MRDHARRTARLDAVGSLAPAVWRETGGDFKVVRTVSVFQDALMRPSNRLKLAPDVSSTLAQQTLNYSKDPIAIVSIQNRLMPSSLLVELPHTKTKCSPDSMSRPATGRPVRPAPNATPQCHHAHRNPPTNPVRCPVRTETVTLGGGPLVRGLHSRGSRSRHTRHSRGDKTQLDRRGYSRLHRRCTLPGVVLYRATGPATN